MNCEVLLGSADSTKFEEICFANEIVMLVHGKIFIKVEITGIPDAPYFCVRI